MVKTIAVSAEGTNLDSLIAQSFERCPYFIFVDPDTMDFDVIANSGATASGGAGVAAAQMVASKGVDVVLTGNCGPNAFSVLESAKIKVMTGVTGTVQDAIKDYKAEKYEATSQANVGPHSGMKANGS